ncbi:MAG: DUF4301 family protein [Bacteroidetes bacterium]|nr:DUF4301 family protein [Bacteroidota bacterium]
MEFTDLDLAQFREKGIPVELIQQQIKNFEQGFPFLNAIRPATIGDGILQVPPQQINEYTSIYDRWLEDGGKVYKFVPASGAASRMFKHLFNFLALDKDEMEQNLLEDKNFGSVYYFFQHLENFAFYRTLKRFLLDMGKDISSSKYRNDFGTILDTLLSSHRMNYGNLPKALLEFHGYDDVSRTSFEEHLVEGARYCKNANAEVFLHFTVSLEHQIYFDQLLKDILDQYEKVYGVKYHISFSQQKPSTDTIAVDLENEPFRNDNGTVAFRPGGHGALLDNLNGLEADLVFIKNTDNVVPDRLKDLTIIHKKLIADVLLEAQNKIFNYLKILKNGDEINEQLLAEIDLFLENKLCTTSAVDKSKWDNSHKTSWLTSKLNRPLRVCGMVVNTGEPGGGPFWSENSDGTISLQIAETPQLNLNDSGQKTIFQSSTHFSPTDIVCGLKDDQGNKFDLTKYRDPKTGFISHKSKDGKELKAQELPGLWNGSMADWNTIFVEVPIETFNPVKTVNDLLRKQHQP